MTHLQSILYLYIWPIYRVYFIYAYDPSTELLYLCSSTIVSSRTYHLFKTCLTVGFVSCRLIKSVRFRTVSIWLHHTVSMHMTHLQSILYLCIWPIYRVYFIYAYDPSTEYTLSMHITHLRCIFYLCIWTIYNVYFIYGVKSFCKVWFGLIGILPAVHHYDCLSNLPNTHKEAHCALFSYYNCRSR